MPFTLDQLEAQPTPKVAALFCGDQGCGKSCAVASFAEAGWLKDYDLDKRARGMLGLKWSPEILKRIIIERDINISNGFEKLETEIELDLLRKQTKQSPDLQTVAFESFATLQKIFMYDSMRLRGAIAPAGVKKIERKDAEGGKGRFRGSVAMPHPDDYNYVSQAIHQLIFKGLFMYQINVIVSAWVVDEWGKPPGDNQEYARSIVVGKKLLGTDKLVSEVPGYFDEVYYFNKEETGQASQPVRYTVEFESKLAKTSIKQLRGLGKIDWTGRSFYRIYQHLLTGQPLTPEVGRLDTIQQETKS